MQSVKDINFRGKSVFLRVDFNVPFNDEQKILDDTRIKAALPTLKHLLEQNAKVVVASHLGRPKGEFNPEFSMKPVSDRLSELIPQDVISSPDVIGDEVDRLKEELQEGQVLILENLRFFPGEKANLPDFSKELAKGIDGYVNDAFGACHRAHASIVGIPKLVHQKAAGFLVQKEVEYLQKAVFSPEQPYVAILGGAKVSDKIPVINSLMKKAQTILIGGAMAYTFFSARGFQTGRSLVEEDRKELALEILDKARNWGIKFALPLDHVVAPEISQDAPVEILADFPIPEDKMGLDIGPNTIAEYSAAISQAKTIFWNGPMGVFEVEHFSHGTKKIGEAVAESSALSIVGGGDSVAALYKAGVQDRISHISTGGGASLEYIANETLPGIEALT